MFKPMYLFGMLADLLPARLRPAAKAVYPALATVVAVGAQYAATGAFDQAEMTTAIVGLFSAALTYMMPNAKTMKVSRKT